MAAKLDVTTAASEAGGGAAAAAAAAASSATGRCAPTTTTAAVAGTPAAAAGLVRVRVEDGSSIGRSYSRKAESAVVPGLGASRRALRTATWRAAYGLDAPDAPLRTLESFTYAKIHLSSCTREDIRAYFRNTWDLTTTWFGALRDDSVFYAVPDKLRRPLVFYSAHPAAFYVNKMHLVGLMDNINLYYQKLFETGVDEMSWDDMDVMQEEDFAWPDIADVVRFREDVKALVEALIDAMPDPAVTPITQESPYWGLVMGFEHERIHIETSAVLFHQLPLDSVVAPPGWRTAPSAAPTAAAAPTNAMVAVPAGVAVVGKPRDFPSFGFDNEYGSRRVDVPAFSASAFLVSNAEFLPFVLAGGYRERRWWVSGSGDDEGWRWASFRNATHPSFWVATRHPDMAAYIGGKPGYPYQKDDGCAAAGDGPDFKLRTLFHIIDMPWDWPAEVNFHEAHAFMRWKAASEGGRVTYRVPTEAEYHLIRGDAVPGEGATTGVPGAPAGPASAAAILAVSGADAGRVLLPDGSVATGAAGAAAEAAGRGVRPEAAVDVMMQAAAPGNLNLRWGSSTPVNMYAPSSTGFYDAHGNVWQYAEDHFAPLPGFEIHYMYDDFSSPCFDGWHTLILGGSWVSTGDQASSFARYHFRRHFFQHLGFRYVAVPAAAPEPYPGAATVTNLWEGMSTVSNDLTNGYAPAADRVPFPRALVDTDNALAYAANLAAAAAAAYASHAVGGPAKGAARALLLGCGVGEVAFALAAAGFGAVVGVDAREAAVRHARIMQHHAQFEYERVREGVLTTTALVRTPAGVDRSRVTFFNSPLAALSPDAAAGGAFDLVLVNDALCHAVQPLDIVTALGGYVRPGGVAVVACSNDWDAAVTPRNSWLGGFKLNGEDMTTLHMLQHYLKRGFAFKEVVDVPRMTRAHGRKFTLEVLETSVFQRAA